MKPDFQRRIQRYGWDKAAPYYESGWQKQLWPAQKRFLKAAKLEPGQNVLDVACGTGLITFPAARSIAPGNITGIDISEQMIETAKEVAQKENINAEFKRMEAETLDFPDNTFDLALCSLGLMYVPDPVQALKEIHRVLEPGGYATALVWGKRNECGWAEIFPIVDRRVQSDVCPLFFQQGTGDTLKKSFLSARFTNVGVVRFKSILHFDSDEQACTAAFKAGPVALAYRRFDNSKKESAHQEYLSSIKPFKKDDSYNIPGEFVIATGYKSLIS